MGKYALKCIIILFQIMILFGTAFAQHPETRDHTKSSGSMHRITIVSGYAFIDNSFIQGNNGILMVPVFGLNYDYFFNSKWGLGLHSDILVQQFKAEKHGNKEEIIRENPAALCGIILYKPHHRWTTFAGYGIELEKHENLQLVRVGVEYGIELPKNWELGFSLEFDYKPDAYNSLLFGIGFSKLFSRTSK